MANEKGKRVKLVTPVGRLSFPAIFEKETPMAGSTGPGKYAATIIFDSAYIKAHKDELDRYNAIKAEADRACEKMFKKPLNVAIKEIARFWTPFRNGAEKKHLDGYGEGTIFFKASSQKKRPGVLASDKKTVITDPEAIYSGCYVRLTVSPYAFDNKMKGVGIGLMSVMFIRDGVPLDGSSNPADDFGEIPVDDMDDPLAEDDDLL